MPTYIQSSFLAARFADRSESGTTTKEKMTKKDTTEEETININKDQRHSLELREKCGADRKHSFVEFPAANMKNCGIIRL